MTASKVESSEGTSGAAEAIALDGWRVGKGKPPVEYQFPKGRSGWRMRADARRTVAESGLDRALGIRIYRAV